VLYGGAAICLIIPYSSVPTLSNNIIQKGLAFGRDWSSSVVNSGRRGAPRSCPAGLMAEVGLRWCGANAAIHRTEDLDVKICEEAVSCLIGGACSCCKTLATDHDRSQGQGR